MKNKYQEYLKQGWKKHQRDYFNHEGWLYIPHVYEEPYKTLSWWDDFSFKSHNHVVSVCWIHPRMKYQDECKEQACILTRQQGYEYQNEFKKGSFIPYKYKKVGKSRKKAVFFIHKQSDINREYFDKLWGNEKLILNNGDVSVGTHIHTSRTRYGVHIEICFPVELKTKDDIITFAKNIKHLYENNNLYPVVNSTNVVYNKSNWNQEQGNNSAD